MEHIAFRVDATVNLASGHLMRCLTLANKLKERSAKIHITFITGQLQNQFKRSIIDTGFELHQFAINADHADWHQTADIELCHQAVKQLPPITLLVVDHYLLDIQWEQAMAPYCQKLLVIDDLANRQHDCDYLLDQTYGRQVADYLPLVPHHCQLLLGQPFMLLRDEFYKIREKAQQKRQQTSTIKHLLISLGGVDANNATGKILALLANTPFFPDIFIDVIITSNAPHLAELQALNAKHRQIKFIVDCSEVAMAMFNADFAIGASGTSAWERCSLGLPSISVILAENQRNIGNILSDQGAHINLGNVESISDHSLTKAIEYLSNNNHYQTMANHAFSCCDGRGAARLVTRLNSPDIVLKQASIDDLMTTYHWQSNAIIRQYSRQPKPVTLAEHTAWFKASLLLESRTLFILYINNLPAGVLRLDKLEKTFKDNDYHAAFEVSILIEPTLQGKGIALKALLAIPSEYSVQGIYAFVNKKNKASQALFSRANFIRVSDEQFIRPARY